MGSRSARCCLARLFISQTGILLTKTPRVSNPKASSALPIVFEESSIMKVLNAEIPHAKDLSKGSCTARERVLLGISSSSSEEHCVVTVHGEKSGTTRARSRPRSCGAGCFAWLAGYFFALLAAWLALEAAALTSLLLLTASAECRGPFGRYAIHVEAIAGACKWLARDVGRRSYGIKDTYFCAASGQYQCGEMKEPESKLEHKCNVIMVLRCGHSSEMIAAA